MEVLLQKWFKPFVIVAIPSITSRLGKLIPDYAKWCPKPKVDEHKKKIVDLPCPAGKASGLKYVVYSSSGDGSEPR